MLTRITFESLFDIMLAELPVITNTTCDNDYNDWCAQYYDPGNEWCVFLEVFGHSILVAAQRQGIDKGISYHITEVNREYIRTRMEEELHDGLTDSRLQYTTRDSELVGEYLRLGYATPSHDATSKKRGWGPRPEVVAEEEKEQQALRDRGYVPDKPMFPDELADLLDRVLRVTPSQAESEFASVPDTQVMEHKENGSIWKRNYSRQDGYIWKVWLERTDWEMHRDPWSITADGKAEELEGLEELEG